MSIAAPLSRYPELDGKVIPWDDWGDKMQKNILIAGTSQELFDYLEAMENENR